MTQQLIKPIDINNIANDIEKSHNLEMYWNYNDNLTDEQIIRLIKEEDYLYELENELYEYNSSYIFEIVDNSIKEYLKEKVLILTEEQQDELRQECESRFNFNINDLIKNSSCRIRMELLSNEDMIYYENWKKSPTIKDFRRRFKGCFRIKDLEREFNNLPNDYALITFYFKVSGMNILKLREEVLKGYITLKKGLEFGLFNSWLGGGSVLEIPLIRDITLNLKDWRIKNQKEEVIKGLKEGDKRSYYEVSIKADKTKYGINEVYGLTGEGWKEF